MRYLAVVGAPWGFDAVDRVCGVNLEWTTEPKVIGPAPRFVFFLNYSQKVPSAFIRQHECVNFHCTPLPIGRGGHPIENLILLGYKTTVITAHRMTEEMDAGPIYGTRGPVGLTGTKERIQQRFVDPVADLIQWIVKTEPTPYPQEGTAVVFRRLAPAEYEKFWEERCRA